MQVINDTNSGGRIGQALATGLQQFAHNKLQHLTNQYNNYQASKGLESLGFSPEEATSLSYLDPNIQREVVKQRLQAPSQEAFAQYINELLNPSQSGQQFDQSQQMNHQQETGLQALQQPMQQLPEFSAADYLSSFPGAATAQRAGLNQRPAVQAVNPQLNQPQANMPTVNKPKPRLNERQALELAKLGLQKEKADTSLSKDAREFLKPYQEAYDSARGSNRDYDQLIEIAKTGQIYTGNGRLIASKLKLGDFNRNVPTQIADKFIAQQGLRARAAYGPGTRLTNFLEQSFQRTLPGIWNTPEGLIAISEINKIRNEVENIVPQQERIKVIEENKGKIPFNINEIVEKRIKPKIEKLAQQETKILKDASDKVKNRRNRKSAPSINKTFATLPNPSEFNDKQIRDKQTGKILTSNGTNWV